MTNNKTTLVSRDIITGKIINKQISTLERFAGDNGWFRSVSIARRFRTRVRRLNSTRHYLICVIVRREKLPRDTSRLLFNRYFSLLTFARARVNRCFPNATAHRSLIFRTFPTKCDFNVTCGIQHAAELNPKKRFENKIYACAYKNKRQNDTRARLSLSCGSYASIDDVPTDNAGGAAYMTYLTVPNAFLTTILTRW